MIWPDSTRHVLCDTVLCDNLEGWAGVGDGREVYEGGAHVYL